MSGDFVPKDLLDIDKKYNFPKYSGGVVIMVDVQKYLESLSKLGIPINQNTGQNYIRFKEGELQREIKKETEKKRRRYERNSYMSEYDVEMGSTSR